MGTGPGEPVDLLRGEWCASSIAKELVAMLPPVHPVDIEVMRHGEEHKLDPKRPLADQ